MRTRASTLLSLGVGVAALLPLRLLAAEAFEENIPKATVEILLGLGADPEAGLYRDVPEAFPLQELPEGLQVLGSVVHGSGQISLHLRSDDSTETPVERLVEAMSRAGWQALPVPPIRQAGFSDLSRPRIPRLFCLEGSGSLTFDTTTEPDFRVLRLHWMAEGLVPSFSCRELLRVAEGVAPGLVPLADHMPELLLPVEADHAGRPPGPTGSLSGGSSGYRSSTFLRLAWEPGRLNAHFAGQLRDQGWSLVEDWSGAALGGSLWRRSVAGLELLGLLTLTRRQAGDYHLDFLLLDAGQEGQ